MAGCACTGEKVDSPQDLQLMDLLGHYRGYDGSLIPVLQGVQEIYGYLPAEEGGAPPETTAERAGPR